MLGYWEIAPSSASALVLLLGANVVRSTLHASKPLLSGTLLSSCKGRSFSTVVNTAYSCLLKAMTSSVTVKSSISVDKSFSISSKWAWISGLIASIHCLKVHAQSYHRVSSSSRSFGRKTSGRCSNFEKLTPGRCLSCCKLLTTSLRFEDCLCCSSDMACTAVTKVLLCS